MSENWRTEVSAGDYFGNRKKRADIEARRPAVRKPSDLGLGPGMSASAVRVTNWNDTLATFNGYYSAAAGAANAPNAVENFVGVTVMDDVFGGRQLLTGLASGTQWKRTFTRSTQDAGTVSWGAWVSDAPPAAPTIPPTPFMRRPFGGTSTAPFTGNTWGTLTVHPTTGVQSSNHDSYYALNSYWGILKKGVYQITVVIDGEAGLASAALDGRVTCNGQTSPIVQNVTNPMCQLIVPLTADSSGAGQIITVEARYPVANEPGGNLRYAMDVVRLGEV